mgnify:CR=1 FL=1
MEHPGWTGWVGLLRDMRGAALEELARCSEPGDFRYWQGVVAALGEMLDRPAHMVARANEVNEVEQDANPGRIRPELRALVGAGIDYEGDV